MLVKLNETPKAFNVGEKVRVSESHRYGGLYGKVIMTDPKGWSFVEIGDNNPIRHFFFAEYLEKA